MQRPGFLPDLIRSFERGPTVGGLVDLCEENYYLLKRLVPDLERTRGKGCSCLSNHMDLYLEVLEKTSYMSILHLTYYFDHHEGQEPDPDVVLRVYHDANQAEVLSLRQNSLPLHQLFEAPGLLNKWRANLFISKWLAFCIQQGHGFHKIPVNKSDTRPVELAD